MNRSEIDQRFLDEITNNLYPTLEPADMATEMAAGTEPAGARPMTVEQFATSAADVPAGLLKGAIQGTVGLPGDIISLVRGVYELGKSGGDINAFLSGLEMPTGLPTTEDVRKFFDETLGIPLVPEEADEIRKEVAKIPEFVGELGGAGKTVIEGTKAVTKRVRKKRAATAATGLAAPASAETSTEQK
jgi:hypothetical protein